MTDIQYGDIRFTINDYGYVRCKNDGAVITPPTFEEKVIAAAINAHIEHCHR